MADLLKKLVLKSKIPNRFYEMRNKFTLILHKQIFGSKVQYFITTISIRFL